MSHPAIAVENLTKVYRIGQAERRTETLVGAVTSALKAPARNLRNLYRLGTAGRDEAEDTIRAVDDVSFEVQPGEVLGVIGRNGAGKSTLLKILSRITKPTSGRVRMRGRVSSLLEVGTGFHPELTGRENVYLNGTILGMTKREIDRKFDEIVDFSGVAKFLDTPVKRYSSGMTVRLAFAVAAHLEPDILLVDEVLAVGDAGFQEKCMGKMGDIANQGRTVLLVSHNMASVKALCSECCLIDNGRLAMAGDPNDVIRGYLERSTCRDRDLGLTLPDGPFALEEITVRQEGVACGEIINSEGPFEIAVRYAIREEVGNVLLGFDLLSSDGALIFRSYDLESWGMEPRAPGSYESVYEIDSSCLNSGVYYAVLIVGVHRRPWISKDRISIKLNIGGIRRSDVDFPGMIRSPGSWTVRSTAPRRPE